jgi:hypothetical protein
VVDDLPCAQETGAAALAGADGHGGRYETRLTYLLEDPRGHTASWIQTNGRPCADQPSGDPRYAYIQSTGRSSDGVTRTLFGTYVFMAATDPNVPGGQIRSYPAAGHNPLCFDAGPDPKPGTVVLVQPCDSTVPARQRFAYTPALTLVSLSSFATVPDGLCVDGGRSHAVGVVVTLQPCSVPAGTNQQWALDQGARFQAFGTNKKLDGFCITVENDNTGGSRLVLTDDSVTTGTGTCNDGNLDPRLTWAPSSDVGAGVAGPATRQLVNFGLFGWCLDLDRFDFGRPLIAYPCKQAPDQTLTWNQQWTCRRPAAESSPSPTAVAAPTA